MNMANSRGVVLVPFRALLLVLACGASIVFGQQVIAPGRDPNIHQSDVKGTFRDSCESCRWETWECRAGTNDPGANFSNNALSCLCKPYRGDYDRYGVCYQFCPNGQLCNKNGVLTCGNC